MTQTQKHYGFAQVPRLVLRGDKFKDLTLIEKGLYASLKDICGDDGECFYTFRNLAKEIHTSISTLSRYIPKLVNAGLITAEKKVRSVNKHEVFHIRIVNIWEENDALYRPLDTKNGFTEKQIIVSDRNKSDVNTNIVSDRNNSVSDRNKNNDTQAQDCFYLNDRIRSNNNNLSEEDTYVNANALTRTPSQENENETHYQHSDGSSQQHIHTDQASTDIPIVTTTPQTALIGVATRNTDSLPSVTQAAANKTRGSRKPKVTKPEDESMGKRIDAVLNCLDELGTEYAGEEFHYSRFKTDKEAVKTLLTSWQNLSREQVQATYRFMMDTPKSDDGWLWSDHMSVKAFCNNFATQYAKMRKKGVSNGHNAPMSALDQAISATRNLAKDMAEMEARYSRKRAQ